MTLAAELVYSKSTAVDAAVDARTSLGNRESDPPIPSPVFCRETGRKSPIPDLAGKHWQGVDPRFPIRPGTGIGVPIRRAGSRFPGLGRVPPIPDLAGKFTEREFLIPDSAGNGNREIPRFPLMIRPGNGNRGPDWPQIGKSGIPCRVSTAGPGTILGWMFALESDKLRLLCVPVACTSGLRVPPLRPAS